MTTVPTCAPAEGAEDGICKVCGGRKLIVVSQPTVGRSGTISCPYCIGVPTVGVMSSPTDASDLAAARREIDAYRGDLARCKGFLTETEEQLAAACKERDAMRARALTWAAEVRALAHATNDSWRRAEAIRLFVDMKSASTVRAADGEDT